MMYILNGRNSTIAYTTGFINMLSEGLQFGLLNISTYYPGNVQGIGSTQFALCTSILALYLF